MLCVLIRIASSRDFLLQNNPEEFRFVLQRIHMACTHMVKHAESQFQNQLQSRYCHWKLCDKAASADQINGNTEETLRKTICIKQRCHHLNHCSRKDHTWCSAETWGEGQHRRQNCNKYGVLHMTYAAAEEDQELEALVYIFDEYSRPSVARTLIIVMARLPRLFRIRSLLPRRKSYSCRFGIF